MREVRTEDAFLPPEEHLDDWGTVGRVLPDRPQGLPDEWTQTLWFLDLVDYTAAKLRREPDLSSPLMRIHQSCITRATQALDRLPDSREKEVLARYGAFAQTRIALGELLQDGQAMEGLESHYRLTGERMTRMLEGAPEFPHFEEVVTTVCPCCNEDDG